MRLNRTSSEEVDCFKYLGSQVAANGGSEWDVVHRMNEGHEEWGLLTPGTAKNFKKVFI